MCCNFGRRRCAFTIKEQGFRCCILEFRNLFPAYILVHTVAILISFVIKAGVNIVTSIGLRSSYPIIAGRQRFVIVLDVRENRRHDLLDLGVTARLPRLLARPGEDREQNRRQDGDDLSAEESPSSSRFRHLTCPESPQQTESNTNSPPEGLCVALYRTFLSYLYHTTT